MIESKVAKMYHLLRSSVVGYSILFDFELILFEGGTALYWFTKCSRKLASSKKNINDPD